MKPSDHFNPHRLGPGATTDWDRFRLHHVFTDKRLFVHFETGETCITTRFVGRLGNSDYRLYRDRNVIIASTTNDLSVLLKKHDLALVDPKTGTHIPTTWLQKTDDGSLDAQLMAIDLDHLMAVNIRPARGAVGGHDPRRNWVDRKPKHIQQAPGAYYPTRDAEPEGYSIRLSRPYKMDADEKEHMESIKTACRAWWEMSGWAEKANQLGVAPVSLWHDLCDADNKSSADPVRRAPHHQAHTAASWNRVKTMAFNDMPCTLRYQIVRNGITTLRTLSLHSHLRVESTA